MNSNNASWEIKDFTFQNRQVVPTVFETIVTAQNGNRFGLIYRAAVPAPDNVIFDSFKRDRKLFFIDVDSSSVPLKRVRKNVKLLTNGENLLN